MDRLDAYHLYESDGSYRELDEAFAWEVPEQFNVADYLCERWAARSTGTALVVEDETGTPERYTFGRLSSLSGRLANALADVGVREGSRVAVCGSQRAEVIVAHLAAWKLGAISVPLSTLLGTDGLRYRLGDSGATAVVTDDAVRSRIESLRPELPELEHVIPFDGDGQRPFSGWIDGYTDGRETAETAPDQPAMLLYTSGTTGKPKGAVHAHRSILGTLPTFITSKLNLEPPDGDLTRTVVDWSWTGSLNNTVLPSLYFGIPVLGDTGDRFDPETEAEMIESHGVTLFNCPPTAARTMMDEPDALAGVDLGSVRLIATGGESVDDAVIEWFRDTFRNAVVHEVYGQTEAPTFFGDCSALGIEHRSGRMGKPSIGHEVRVVDPDDPPTEVAAGEVGEIALRCNGDPVCFDRYWKRPEATAEKYAGEWLLTEDLAAVDEDGYYSFYERKDNVIISSGYRIGPAEIEECLERHDDVLIAGVIGTPDDKRGEIPKAFVVPSDETAEIETTELQAFVKRRLAKHKYPREIEVVDELPRTVSGKIDRAELEAKESRR